MADKGLRDLGWATVLDLGDHVDLVSEVLETREDAVQEQGRQRERTEPKDREKIRVVRVFVEFV